MVKKVRKCPKCGTEFPTGRVLCHVCGAILREVEKEENKHRGDEESGGLPRHWLRKYLLKILLWPMIIMLVGGVLILVLESLIAFVPFGVTAIIFLVIWAIAYAGDTPWRKYNRIFSLSENVRDFIEHWGVGGWRD